MQTIADYLLSALEGDDVEDIDVSDVYGFLQYLIGTQMAPQQMVDEIGLYELELTRVAHEGYLAGALLSRLLAAPARPKNGYVVGL